MTSTPMQRIIPITAPLILLCVGSALTWQFPNAAATPILFMLAIVTTYRAPGRYLAAVAALVGTAVIAAKLYHLGTSPSLVDWGWLAGLWSAAAFIIWRSQLPLLDPQSLSNALHNDKTGLVITALDGKIVSTNELFTELFNLAPAEGQGNFLASYTGVEIWHSLTDLTKDSGDDDESLNGSVNMEVHPDNGAKRVLSCQAHLASDVTGKASYYVIQMNDITQDIAAKRSLRTADIQLRRMLGKSSDLVLFVDPKLSITYANDNARNALGPDSGELVGQPAYKYIRTQDRRTFMKTMEQFVRQERNEASIEELQLSDGDNTPVTAHVVRITQPPHSGYTIFFSVVELHLQALANSKISQARFSQIFHGTPDAILLIRASDTVILDFNEGFTRLLGYSREQAIGEQESELGIWAHTIDRDLVEEEMTKNRELTDHETTFKTRDDKQVHVEISLRYVEIDNQLCILCIGRDITKRISAEAALVESESKFQKVFSESPDGIAIIRFHDGLITDVNEAMLSRSDYQRPELIGTSIFGDSSIIGREDLEKSADELAKNGKMTNEAMTFYRKGGEAVPVLISATVMELAGDSYIMIIAKDVSKQRTTEERLRRSEERFRGIFENAPIGIMLVDMQGRIFQANRTAADLLAYEENLMQGIHVSRLVPSEDRPILKESLSDLIVKQMSTHKSERRMICQDGLEIWTNFHVVLQQTSTGEALYYIVQIADITNIKRSQQRMERMAFYDTLTNLANRRLFTERLEHAIEHCVRTNRASALLYLDLDNFKRVNDTLGHQVGDNLLREVSSRLQQCVRKEDTVGRTGGDEFTILLMEIGSPTDAGVVAQKILNHLREPINVSGHPLIVTTSIGITVMPGDALDPNVLMRNADLAMYKAKERGRNNYQFYSEDLNTNAIKRLRTEYEIRQALEQNEFELYYQPKVALRSRQIVGVESLIRWNHPERGVLSPDEFIEVAEDTGSIIDIGAWVIEEACRACQELTKQHDTPIQVAINISPRQFRDPNLVATMRRSIREADLDPKNIEIEITETMLMQDVEAAQMTVERLSELGVSLAIDDFGTGYSSLNYLKRFPINTVKVDRSFVTDLPFNADDMAITRAVIAMAHQLKMEVVAEGVETMEQMEFLANQKCEYAQGWLFSKALSLEGLLKLLEEDRGEIRFG